MLQYRVSRTVTEKTADDIPAESRAIADYRERPAYVLLGEPGAGKSTLFEDEAKLTDGQYISARDFIDLDNDEWREKTLFIDGLDEARAGKDDARTERSHLACAATHWMRSPSNSQTGCR